MRKTLKFIIGCCCMMVIGFFTLMIGYAMGGRVYGIGINASGIWVNTPNLSGERVTYREEAIELDEFSAMNVQIDYGKLTIESSDHFGIAYGKNSDTNFSAEVKDGCLTVSEQIKPSVSIDNRFVFLGIGSSNPFAKKEYVTLYLPRGVRLNYANIVNESGDVTGSSLCADTLTLDAWYGDVDFSNISCSDAAFSLKSGKLKLTDFSDGNLSINNDYGTSTLKHISAKNISATNESGDISAENITADNLSMLQKYGDICFQNITVAKAASITSESGAIKLTNFTAGSVQLKSDYGSVTGASIAADTSSFALESGDLELEQFAADNISVESDYGDVKLDLAESVYQYSMDLYTDYGQIRINKEKLGETYKTLESKEKDRTIKVKCESGNIILNGE